MGRPPPSGAGGSGQVPDEADGIQVNFCREPVCDNFGRPPVDPVRRGLADRAITEADILAFPGVAPPMVRTKPKVPRKRKADDPTEGPAPPPPKVSDQIPF